MSKISDSNVPALNGLTLNSNVIQPAVTPAIVKFNKMIVFHLVKATFMNITVRCDLTHSVRGPSVDVRL